MRSENSMQYVNDKGPITQIYIVGHDIPYGDIYRAVERQGSASVFLNLETLGATSTADNILSNYSSLLQKISHEKKISTHVEIVVLMHGEAKEKHIVEATPGLTMSTIELLGSTQNALQLNSQNSTTHIYSCYGGKVIHDLKTHKPDLNIGLIAHTEPDLIMNGIMAIDGVCNMIVRANDLKQTGEMRTLHHFMLDTITGNDLSTSYYLSRDGKCARGTARPHAHSLSQSAGFLRLKIHNALTELQQYSPDLTLRLYSTEFLDNHLPRDWHSFHTRGLMLAASFGNTDYITAYSEANLNRNVTFRSTSALDLALHASDMPTTVRCLLKNGFTVMKVSEFLDALKSNPEVWTVAADNLRSNIRNGQELYTLLFVEHEDGLPTKIWNIAQHNLGEIIQNGQEAFRLCRASWISDEQRAQILDALQHYPILRNRHEILELFHNWENIVRSNAKSITIEQVCHALISQYNNAVNRNKTHQAFFSAPDLTTPVKKEVALMAALLLIRKSYKNQNSPTLKKFVQSSFFNFVSSSAFTLSYGNEPKELTLMKKIENLTSVGSGLGYGKLNSALTLLLQQLDTPPGKIDMEPILAITTGDTPPATPSAPGALKK